MLNSIDFLLIAKRDRWDNACSLPSLLVSAKQRPAEKAEKELQIDSLLLISFSILSEDKKIFTILSFFSACCNCLLFSKKKKLKRFTFFAQYEEKDTLIHLFSSQIALCNPTHYHYVTQPFAVSTQIEEKLDLLLQFSTISLVSHDKPLVCFRLKAVHVLKEKKMKEMNFFSFLLQLQ